MLRQPPLEQIIQPKVWWHQAEKPCCTPNRWVVLCQMWKKKKIHCIALSLVSKSLRHKWRDQTVVLHLTHLFMNKMGSTYEICEEIITQAYSQRFVQKASGETWVGSSSKGRQRRGRLSKVRRVIQQNRLSFTQRAPRQNQAKEIAYCQWKNEM